MKEATKKTTKKVSVSLSIETPSYDVTEMFLHERQVKNTYLFMCSRYVNYLKSGEFEKAETMKKLVIDYIIMGEGQEFKGFNEVVSIK